MASYLTPQGGVRFAQPVPEGTSLTIMEAVSDDMIAAGQEALRKAMLRSGTIDPAVVLVFSCALPTLPKYNCAWSAKSPRSPPPSRTTGRDSTCRNWRATKRQSAAQAWWVCEKG